MPQQLKSLLIIFSIFILLFIGVRYLLIPKSFGELGHYRKDALNEIGALPIRFVGKESCKKCHPDKVQLIEEGVHAHLQCEICHGPAYKHVQSPDTLIGKNLPDSMLLNRTADRAFCAKCHSLNMARIKIKNDTIDNTVIHQIDERKHNLLDENGKERICITCHNPHDPW
jgi:hypothetical protein